jgi:hypothetical protein
MKTEGGEERSRLLAENESFPKRKHFKRLVSFGNFL